MNRWIYCVQRMTVLLQTFPSMLHFIVIGGDAAAKTIFKFWAVYFIPNYVVHWVQNKTSQRTIQHTVTGSSVHMLSFCHILFSNESSFTLHPGKVHPLKHAFLKNIKLGWFYFLLFPLRFAHFFHLTCYTVNWCW